MAFNRDRFMATTYGHATSDWETARAWTARRLRKVAHSRSTITYSQLADELARAGILRLEPQSAALAGLLGQVNLLEHEAGDPLISALVVHKDGDAEPGSGFWSFAYELGIDPGAGEQARLTFWVSEVERCYARWAN